MANKTKQFKKFASSGKLKDTINSRRQHQQIRRKAEDRTARRAKQRGAPNEWDKPGAGTGNGDEDEDEDDARDAKSADATAGGRAGGVAKNVEELFGTGGLDVDADAGSDLEELSEGDDEDPEEEEEEEEEGEEGDVEMSEAAMKKAMKELEKKDPEFFKYLKENDQDLLSFGNEPASASKGKGKRVQEDDEDEEMASVSEGEDDEPAVDEDDDEQGENEPKKIEVTMKMIRQWQEGMLKVSSGVLYIEQTASYWYLSQQHSVRSLRKTLLAFRTAAHMNEDDADQGSGLDTKYAINSAQGAYFHSPHTLGAKLTYQCSTRSS